MTKTSADALEEVLGGLKLPAPLETPSIEEQQLQQQGNDPAVVDDEIKRLRRLHNDRYEAESKHWTTIYDLRSEYIPKLFYMILCWLMIAGFFVFLSGLKAPRFNDPNCSGTCFGFSLSDGVLIAFITSTTATVIGIFVLVVAWLFPSRYKEENQEKK